MRITNKKCPPLVEYSIGNTIISQTDSFKYLGIKITNSLSWSSYIERICAFARRKVGPMRHKLKYVPSHVKLLAYNTLIRSRLQYACTVWDSFTKKDINMVEQVQRLVVRFMYVVIAGMTLLPK